MRESSLPTKLYVKSHASNQELIADISRLGYIHIQIMTCFSRSCMCPSCFLLVPQTKLVKMRRKSVMGVGTPGTEDNDEDPTLQIPPQDMDVGSHASETELGGGMNESSTVSHTSRTTTPNINDTSRPVLHEHSGAPQHISPDKDGSHVNRGRSQNGLQRRGSDGTPNPWEEEEEDRGTRVGGGRTRRLSSDEESEDGALVIADDDGDNSGPASPHTVSAGSL